MKFLADEDVHADVVAWLRSLGNDVLYAAESLASFRDDAILALVTKEARIIITDDLDFGELVFHRHLPAHGIILMRLSASAIEARIDRLKRVWTVIEARMPGSFVAIGNTKVRIRPLA